MTAKRSYQFTHAIVREPANSVVDGLRDGDGPNPDAMRFIKQHEAYTLALKEAGAKIVQLPALEAFPDSVFVEDTCLCLKEAAIILRPGAASRFGESAQIKPALTQLFSKVIQLPDEGFIDGGGCFVE